MAIKDITDKKIGIEELNEYESILHDLIQTLNITRRVVEVFPKTGEEVKKQADKEIAEILKTCSPEDIEQLKQFREHIQEQFDQIKNFPATVGGKIIFHSKAPAEVIARYTESWETEKKVMPFLNEMSLVYLIINFEEFLKNNLSLVFNCNLNMLKTTKKEISYEEIFNYSNIDEIRKIIIEREIDDMISKDIDKLGQHLLERFNLDLINKENWSKFTERFYRRHTIVHNNGIVDEKYQLKTKQSVNGKLETNQEYILESLEIFKEYGKFISKFFETKFPIKN